MILRDVVMLASPRTVGGATDAKTVPEHGKLAALPDVVEAQLIGPAQPTPTFTSAPQPTPLTFEQVAAWLAVQDGETRVACASLLADELTAAHEAAKANGFKAGEAEARAAFDAQGQRLHEQMAAVTAAAQAAFERECASLGDACADIVAEAFTKIAGSALVTREAILGTVLTVLCRLKGEREVTIRVCAADLPLLQQEEESLKQSLGGRSVHLVADARVAAGGCMVETSMGNIDGRLDVQLRELTETLRAAKGAQAGG